MIHALPFDLRYTLLPRRQVEFRAIRDGECIDVVTYGIGNAKRRSDTATAWAANEALRNGRPLSASEVSAALAATEAQASDDLAEDASDPKEKPTEAASYVDEHLIVELAWNDRKGGVDFVVSDRATHTVSRAERVETGIGAIVPPECCSGIVTPGDPIGGTVFVPTQHDETGEDESTLREDIAAFINTYATLPGDATRLAVEYVLLTWVFDTFDECPYLALRTADIGRGKSRALESIGKLCRLPTMLSGGSTPNAVLRLLDVFGGTLLSDEADQRDSELASELNRILNAGFQRGRPLVKCDGDDNQPRAFRTYSPKIFALRKTFRDDATESRMISVWMTQRRAPGVRLSLPRRKFDKGALAIRNRCLAYRFRNLGRVEIDESHADPRLEDRGNQLGLPLLAIAGTEEARAVVVDALLQQQRRIASDRADSMAGEAFVSVLAVVDEAGVVRPNAVSADMNKRRAAAAGVEVDHLGKRAVNPWMVGRIIKGELELPKLKADRNGAKYELRDHRRAELVARLGIDDAGQTPHPQQTSHENLPFEAVKADCGVRGVCGVSGARPPVAGSNTPGGRPDGYTLDGWRMTLRDRLDRTDDPDQRAALDKQIRELGG